MSQRFEEKKLDGLLFLNLKRGKGSYSSKYSNGCHYWFWRFSDIASDRSDRGTSGQRTKDNKRLLEGRQSLLSAYKKRSRSSGQVSPFC